MANSSASQVIADMDSSLTKDPKPKEDCSEEASTLLSECESLANKGFVDVAIDNILILEKRARQGGDGLSASKLACGILNILKNANRWDDIDEYVVSLCRKRGQLKKCIIDIVALCMRWISNDEIPSELYKLKLIQTICHVTEGKIFVEVERARLIRLLAKVKEDEGNIDEAANLLQEVQVETFGAMERREKAEYILNQMRIMLLKNDYVRYQIISKKINEKLLEPDDFQDIKLNYYNYMIKYYLHENRTFDVCKCYLRIFYTKNIQSDPNLWMQALQSHILYLILSPYDIAKRAMLFRLQEIEEKVSEIPAFKRLVSYFLKDELISWPIPYEYEIINNSVFIDGNTRTRNEKLWNTFRTRVLQHNIKVIGKFYSRITLSRLASLLDITEDEGEKELSELVYAKAIRAKIDRLDGIVRFGEEKGTAEILNDWSGDIAKLLGLVEESSHLIQKEIMIHAARSKKLQVDTTAGL